MYLYDVPCVPVLYRYLDIFICSLQLSVSRVVRAYVRTHMCADTNMYCGGKMYSPVHARTCTGDTPHHTLSLSVLCVGLCGSGVPSRGVALLDYLYVHNRTSYCVYTKGALLLTRGGPLSPLSDTLSPSLRPQTPTGISSLSHLSL